MNDNKEVVFTTQLFEDVKSAEKAYHEALEKGYLPKDINVVMSEDLRNKHYGSVLVKEETKAVQGMGIGSVTGAALGGIVAAIAAIGSVLVVPELGLVFAGPLAAGLVGAGAGAITGGIMGVFVGLGIPEEKARRYEVGVKSGGIVLGVNETKENQILANTWNKYIPLAP